MAYKFYFNKPVLKTDKQYYEQLYVYKFLNLDKMDQFLYKMDQFKIQIMNIYLINKLIIN